MKKKILSILFFTFIFLNEIIAQPVFVSPVPQNSYGFFEANSKLYFFHQDSIWRSDGTGAGTYFLKELLGQPILYYKGSFGNYTDEQPFVLNTVFFFVTKNGPIFNLYRSDGTAVGTTIVASYTDFKPYEVVNNEFYYGALIGSTTHLFKIGATGTPVFLKTLDLAPFPTNLYSGTQLLNFTDHEVIGNTLYFGAYSGANLELWKSNGTSAGTVRVKVLAPLAYLHDAVNVSGILYFAVGRDVWKSNGTEAGTTMVRSFAPEDANATFNFIAFNGKLYFIVANFSNINQALYVSNGTAAGTTIVKDNFGLDTHVTEMGVANDAIYIVTKTQFPKFLYRSDGTTTGTILVKELNSFDAREFTPAANHLFYADHTARGPFFDEPITLADAFQLWQSDLSPEGTDPVKNIFPPMTFPHAQNLTEVNEVLYFTIPGLGSLSLGKYDPNRPEAAIPFFTLVNSETDEDRDWIQNGDTIVIYPGDEINIRYNPSGTTPESVRFILNGSIFTTENTAPYALAGDIEGDYKPWTTAAQGHYSLVAREYSGNNASGTLLRTVTVNFYIKVADLNDAPIVNAGADKSITLPTTSTTLNGTATDPDGSIASGNWMFISGPVTPSITSPSSLNTTVTGLTAVGTYRFRLRATDNMGLSASDDILVTVNPTPSPAVTSFTLINANTETAIMTLTNGALLDYATLPTTNLSIRANTTPATVGSVRFFFDAFTRVENSAPYSLYGDVGGNYEGNTFTLGSHTVTATPYSGSGATGTAGGTLSVTFTVVNSGARMAASNAVLSTCYPNPSSDKINISLEMAGSGNADVSIFDLNGRLMENLFNGNVAAGDMLDFNWNPADNAKGIYIVKIRTGEFEKIEKIVFE